MKNKKSLKILSLLIVFLLVVNIVFGANARKKNIENDSELNRAIDFYIKGSKPEHYETAKKLLSDYVRQNPLSKNGNIYLAHTYYKLQSYNDAIKYYEQAKFVGASIDREQAYNLAYSYKERGDITKNKDDYKKSIENYEKYLDLTKNDNYKQAIGNNNIGVNYDILGDFEKAMQYYKKSFVIEPDFQLAKENLNNKINNVIAITKNINNIYKAKDNYDLIKQYIAESDTRTAEIEQDLKNKVENFIKETDNKLATDRIRHYEYFLNYYGNSLTPDMKTKINVKLEQLKKQAQPTQPTDPTQYNQRTDTAQYREQFKNYLKKVHNLNDEQINAVLQNQDSIKWYQGYLGVTADGKIGPGTAQAAAKQLNFQNAQAPQDKGIQEITTPYAKTEKKTLTQDQKLGEFNIPQELIGKDAEIYYDGKNGIVAVQVEGTTYNYDSQTKIFATKIQEGKRKEIREGKIVETYVFNKLTPTIVIPTAPPSQQPSGEKLVEVRVEGNVVLIPERIVLGCNQNECGFDGDKFVKQFKQDGVEKRIIYDTKNKKIEEEQLEGNDWKKTSESFKLGGVDVQEFFRFENNEKILTYAKIGDKAITDQVLLDRIKKLVKSEKDELKVSGNTIKVLGSDGKPQSEIIIEGEKKTIITGFKDGKNPTTTETYEGSMSNPTAKTIIKDEYIELDLDGNGKIEGDKEKFVKRTKEWVKEEYTLEKKYDKQGNFLYYLVKKTERTYELKENKEQSDNYYEVTTNSVTGEPLGAMVFQNGVKYKVEYREEGVFVDSILLEKITDEKIRAAVSFVVSEKTAWKSRQFFSSVESGLTQFSGLGFYASLFGDFDGWREGVDKIFAESYLGIEYWESAVCSSNIERDSKGVAYVDTRIGLSAIAAHVEATRSEEITLPKGFKATREFLYKITFNVKNGDFDYDPNALDDMRFNIMLFGERDVNVFEEKIELKKGESFGRKLEDAIVQFSNFRYDRICIVFDKVPVRWSLSDKRLCNTIKEPPEEGTILEEERKKADKKEPNVNDF